MAACPITTESALAFAPAAIISEAKGDDTGGA